MAELTDTSPEAQAFLLEGYRRMSPAQKLEQVRALNETVLQLAAARIRRQYGPVSDRELRLRLASLVIDRETMVRAFGWDPDVKGR